MYHYGVFLLQVLEVLRLVAERVGGEAVSEAHQALWEVVPGQPGDDLLQLHAGSARHVDDEVAEVLPVPDNNMTNDSEVTCLVSSHLTTSTELGRTFGSFPLTETLAVKLPSEWRRESESQM